MGRKASRMKLVCTEKETNFLFHHLFYVKMPQDGEHGRGHAGAGRRGRSGLRGGGPQVRVCA